MKFKKANLSPLFAAGIVAPAIGLSGCSVEPENSSGAEVRAKNQAFGLVQPRTHHEFTDEDGLFVTYWERYYEVNLVSGPTNVGTASMTTGPNSYTSQVNYSTVDLDFDDNGTDELKGPNNVVGKGKRFCAGDVISWTESGVTAGVDFGVYGWIEQPLVEYYIDRGRGGSDPKAVGTPYTVGGATWQLTVGKMRQENVVNPNSPLDPSKPQNFLQYNIELVSGTPSAAVDLGAHFAAWETRMQADYTGADPTDWWERGSSDPYLWQEFTKPHYCVIATEMFGKAGTRTATVENINVVPSSSQLKPESVCNGINEDGDGDVDEDWVSGICIVETNHPSAECWGQFGTSTCENNAGTWGEVCNPDVALAPDVCDGLDNDCDGVVDEGITEVACNGSDDDCDGDIDEGSWDLAVACVLDVDEDGIEDVLDVNPFSPTDDFIEPGFGSTGGTIVDRGDQTVVIHDLPGEDGVWIETLPGGGPTEAEISLCGGTVTVTLGPDEDEQVTCPATSCLFASDQLTLLDRAEVSSDFYAGAFLQQWDAKVYGNALSPGNGELWDRAEITGTANLSGTLSGNRDGVGTLNEGAAVDEQALTVYPIEVLLGISHTVPEGGSLALAKGAWGDVVVERDATLVFSEAGEYRFNSLSFDEDTVLDLTAAGTDRVVIAVEGNGVFGDRFQVLGDAELDIFVNGTSAVIGYDVIGLTADLEAPFAHVEVKDRTQFHGCIGGQDVTLGYDTKVNGISTTPPPDPTEPELTYWQTTTGDWGGDYCIQVGAHNPGSTAVEWEVTINTNGSSIYDTWNANFTGTWGTVIATPNQVYNLVIDPGETDTSVGFCAHRWAPGQHATVTVAKK